MQRYAERAIDQAKAVRRHRPMRLHIRDRSRPRDNRPANGTYRDGVAAAVDPAVARSRFARFVERALEDARARGMTDREIARASRVATSTFHRWRMGETKGLPKLPQVRAFCDATGASIEEAMRVLGMTDTEPVPTPEQPMPRDVRILLRRLADPNTPADEATFYRMTLQMLAARAVAAERDERRGREVG